MSQSDAQPANRRMSSVDVLKLKETIDLKLEEKLSSFEGAYKGYSSTAIASLRAILQAIESYKEVPQTEQMEEVPQTEQQKEEVPKEQTEQHPKEEVPQTEQPQETVPQEENEMFEFSKEFFDLLCEKVRELILMMRNADNDEYSPLSIGSINNVGMSLFRRIFFIANEKVIREKTNGRIVYPYVNVDPLLSLIMKNIFLKMYFSPLCDDLVPVYVYAAIPFCRNVEIYHKNFTKHPVYFNRTYPVDGIRDDELDQKHLFDRVNNMKRNNPPGSQPYHYEAPAELTQELTFDEQNFPTL